MLNNFFLNHTAWMDSSSEFHRIYKNCCIYGVMITLDIYFMHLMFGNKNDYEEIGKWLDSKF